MVFPIMFGLAQALLGIVKSAKRGQGKAAKASAAKTASAGAPGGKRGRPADGSSKSGKIRALLGSGLSAAEIAKKVGATTALVYNVKAQAGKSGKRGPGRPRKVAATSMDGLGGILDAVRNTERDRARMRAALEKLQSVNADALA